MKKETSKVFKQIEKAQKVLSVFIILKDGNICGKMVIRNNPKAETTHVAFIIYPFTTHGKDEIAAYERVTGWGFNRQDTGIDDVLRKTQEQLKNELGVELTGNVMLIDHWIQDFARAGFQVIEAI